VFALVLLILGVSLVQNFFQLQRTDPGFDTSHLLVFRVRFRMSIMESTLTAPIAPQENGFSSGWSPLLTATMLPQENGPCFHGFGGHGAYPLRKMRYQSRSVKVPPAPSFAAELRELQPITVG
jgi:hypothetical protein